MEMGLAEQLEEDKTGKIKNKLKSITNQGLKNLFYGTGLDTRQFTKEKKHVLCVVSGDIKTSWSIMEKKFGQFTPVISKK